jgi:palmitoyltransferase ZDHHC13/17
MEGKTAAEKAAEDVTTEQEAPSWIESVGAGAAWSAVKSMTEGSGHGHSHGGVPCDHAHGGGSGGAPQQNGHAVAMSAAAPAPAKSSVLMGDVQGFMQAAQSGVGAESVFDQFIRACTEGDQSAAESLYEQRKKQATGDEDGEKEAAKMLNEECGIGYAALHLACYHGNLEVVEWLLGLPGIDVGAITHDEMYKLGATGLHLAVAAGSLEIVFHMVKNGFVPDIDVRDNRQCTPLVIAAQYGEVVISHFLMRHGADPRAVDQHGDTAMHWAAYKGHSDLVSLYAVGAMSGCDVPINQSDNFGQSALHLAALRGNADTVKTLLDLGAEKANPDAKNKTPRDLAVEKRDPRDRARTMGQMRIEHYLEDITDHKSLMRWFQFSTKGTYYMKMMMVVHTAYAYFAIVLASGVVPATDTLLQTVFFFGLVFCWQMVHRTDPGSLPDDAKAEYEAAIAEMCESGVEYYTRAEGRKLCHTCREVRPLRAKYCRMLRKNVPRFDHHCPWVGNTVGLQNQVWFYSYTFCCLLCCNYWAFPYYGLAHRWVDMGGEARNWSYHVFVSSLYHTFSSLFGIAMWSTHTWLAARNFTTNENINQSRFPHFTDPYTGETKNPFDRGSLLANLADYFGRVSGDDVASMGAGGGKGPGTKTLAQMREEAPLLGGKTVPEMAA